MDCDGPRKKTSLGKSLAKSRAYNLIRDSGETLGEREKSRQVSCRESHQESSRDSLRDSFVYAGGPPDPLAGSVEQPRGGAHRYDVTSEISQVPARNLDSGSLSYP